MDRNRVFDRVTPSFLFPYFSSTRPGFNPESAESRVDPPGQASKLWIRH